MDFSRFTASEQVSNKNRPKKIYGGGFPNARQSVQDLLLMAIDSQVKLPEPTVQSRIFNNVKRKTRKAVLALKKKRIDLQKHVVVAPTPPPRPSTSERRGQCQALYSHPIRRATDHFPHFEEWQSLPVENVIHDATMEQELDPTRNELRRVSLTLIGLDRLNQREVDSLVGEIETLKAALQVSQEESINLRNLLVLRQPTSVAQLAHSERYASAAGNASPLTSVDEQIFSDLELQTELLVLKELEMGELRYDMEIKERKHLAEKAKLLETIAIQHERLSTAEHYITGPVQVFKKMQGQMQGRPTRTAMRYPPGLPSCLRAGHREASDSAHGFATISQAGHGGGAPSSARSSSEAKLVTLRPNLAASTSPPTPVSTKGRLRITATSVRRQNHQHDDYMVSPLCEI